MDFASTVHACAHADTAGSDTRPINLPTKQVATHNPMGARRRWPRFAVDMAVNVRVTTQGPTRTLVCEGQGTDISCGGLAVTAEIDLPVGEQISVEFTPPNGSGPMTFRCFIRNRQGYKYGVEFITENDRDYVATGVLQECLAGERK